MLEIAQVCQALVAATHRLAGLEAGLEAGSALASSDDSPRKHTARLAIENATLRLTIETAVAAVAL